MTWIYRIQLFAIACDIVAIVFLCAAGVNLWRAERNLRAIEQLRRAR